MTNSKKTSTNKVSGSKYTSKTITKAEKIDKRTKLGGFKKNK